VTSTYMEFTLAFGPKPEFSFSFKSSKPASKQYPILLFFAKHLFFIIKHGILILLQTAIHFI
ncbi:hypothetical protein, partial [Blautia obeum]|uniref:hypothetical protein n=1 Tax=Blautia obeum TaxID=40520 RepID=UPI001A9A3C4C